MSETCDHNCESCSASCADRTEESLLVKPHELTRVKKIIAVVSGKGGVGKSLITSMLATLACRQGLHTAILDADITGPSIPRSFGLRGRAKGDEQGLYPLKTKTGIDRKSVV